MKALLREIIKKSPKRVCGGESYPVLSITKEKGLILQSNRFKKRIASADQSNYLVVKRGQLVLSIHLDEGVLGVQEVIEEGAVSPAYKIWDIATDKVRAKYLEWLLKAPRSVEYYKSKAQSSVAGRCNINDKELLDMEIDIPTLTFQDEVLTTINKTIQIIDCRKRELALLDDLIKARFVEVFGDPVRNERKWQTKALEDACISIVDCAHSTPSYTSEDTGFMCIRTSIVKKNRIMWEDIEYIPEEEYIQRIQRKKPEKGDVVYTREGAILGIAAVIDRDCNVALGQRSMLLSPNRAFCTPEFISVAMNFDSFLDNALKGMSGSASPHINVGDIKAFKMILPPIAQQEAFSAFVAQVDKSKVDGEK